MVQRLVRTSQDIVDDACNYAWTEFLRCQPDRGGRWKAWLVTTAQREAWRLHGKEAGHIGLEIEGSRDDMLRERADPRDTFVLRAELRSALDVFATVPERRREVKALQITGLSYHEIGERLGLSYTSVNRLATEANDAIRAERHRLRMEAPSSSVRAERLWQLEQHPPKWLSAAIGRPPGKNAARGAALAWRRTAIAIDDYRRDHAPHLADEALGKRPIEPRAARSFDLAQRAVSAAWEARQPTRRRSLER